MVLPVVKEVIVVLTYGVEEINVGHPFNHSSSYISRNNHTHGEAVIWCEKLSIEHVCNNDILSSIQL